MAICNEYYRGNVNDFHHYKAKLVNGTEVEKERKTLNMPKKICEDFSKLDWSEKVEIRLDKPKNTERLLKVLNSKENDFKINFPTFLEKLYALGTMATIEYKKDDKTIIDYVDGDVILPYKYTNSYIYGIVTISRSCDKENGKDRYYTLLTYHEYDKGSYLKTNELYVSDTEQELGKNIDFKQKYPNIQESEIIETDYPRFQVWRLPIANNFNTGSPMGLSILANQFDKFKSIDMKYDSFDHEFSSGKKRILVSKTAIKGAATGQIDSNGNPIMVSYFDSNDEVYVALNGMEDQPVKEISFDLRTQEHIDAINADLKYLSSGVGLGNNFYEFDGQGVKTATEVISENSDTYRTKVHHQTALYGYLEDMIKAICEMENISYKSVTINPDDSIIEDTDKIRQQATSEYNNGLISKAEYFRRVYKMSEEEAIEFANKMNQEIQEQMISDGSEFDITE